MREAMKPVSLRCTVSNPSAASSLRIDGVGSTPKT
jgi:hypothetical protein